jgi:hypothetical protein
LLSRRIRSLAWRQEAWTEVRYAEYRCRACQRSFRSWPAGLPPRTRYDNAVRQAVLDRLLADGLNVQRTQAAMGRDFLLGLSEGFIHSCLDWELRRLDLPARRQRLIGLFSGTLCIDELHLGRHTLLLATDPIADEVIGFALVGANDQGHLRRFLLMLKHCGFLPRVVITDGSKLYPSVLAELWPRAKHQLCVFHVLADITARVLDAVRRLRRSCEKRGKAGRKRKRGRPKKRAKKRRAARGPTCKEKAAFVFKRRHLVVKRVESLSGQEREDLGRMFSYEPALRTLWEFSQDAYKVWGGGQAPRVARWRWARLLGRAEYQQVPELAQALASLEGGKLEKTLAFLGQPAQQQHKTNNHVERMNRQLRFDEKVRYRWRSRKAIVRWLLLRISRHVPKAEAAGLASAV